MTGLRLDAVRLFFLALILPFSAHANKVLNFNEGSLEQGIMPDGCNNPFRESIRFIEFYDLAIETMAAERGASARGISDLFAVQYLRNLIADESSLAGGEDSAIDRLIVTQICHYEKIATHKNLGSGSKKALQIFAKDPGLHDHLAAISKKLLSDSVALYRTEKKALAKNKDQENFLISRRNEIRKAKNQGEDKVRSLIE